MANRSTRAYTSPWTSVESFNTTPALKKRHSAYALSNSPITTIPNPQFPPPGRISTENGCKARSRHPSFVSEVVVAAWEESSRKASSDAPSVKSRTSSLGLSMRTGPVEEVAPWELYPVPALTKDFKASNLKNHKSFSSTSTSSAPHKTTGPVGEVTPWELFPGPSQPDDNPVSPVSPVSPKQSSVPPVSPPGRPLPNSEHESVPVYPRSTATGPTEDVTPWELTPVPTDGEDLQVPAHVSPSRTMTSLSLTMAQLEEVTPWELYPAPRPSGSNLSGQTQVPNRPSLSSSTKTMSEVGNRPRKSTGSKTSKSARSPIPATGILNIPHESTAFIGQQKGVSSNGVSSTATFGGSPTGAPPTSASHDPTQPHRQDLKFSNMADRTILEQLKMSIQAKEAQFVVKGIGNLVVGGGQSPGKKHHSHPAKAVPYPRSYDREVVDLDVWETMFCLDICKSLTWHVFETPPTKVLELGCGTGTWILHCAQTWKECHFVGLDIVSLHPDLRNVGLPDLASRITWVQHNFLDGLPFQNEEFDFVYIKRIALGVPEDKWDKFFEEVARVMKPGAAFEMVEEDLFFPGKHINEGSITDDFLSSITTHWNSTSPNHRNGFSPSHDDGFESGSPETPTTNTTLLPRTPSRSNSPARDPSSAEKENEEVVVNEEQISYDSFPSPSLPAISVPMTISPTNAAPITFPTMSKEPSSIPTLRRSTSRPLLSVQTEPLYSESGTSPAGFGLSSISLSSAMETVNEAIMSRTRSSSVQTSNMIGASSLNPAAAPDSEPKSTTKPSPLLLKMLTQTPTNPRDHTLLEMIWNEMLSSRWVNSSPLSLLKTYLEWHFQDVRTHPPFMYTFPPTPPKPELADDDSDSDSDADNTPNVASTSPKQSPSIKSSNVHGDDKEQQWLSLQSLQQQQQSFPYVTLDGTRGHAFSPSHQTSLAAKRTSRLPTSTLNIDLRTLNLHLELRAKEILACSESMWEWVEEFQRASKTSIPSLNAPSNRSLDMTRCAILEMTRDDFDLLLNNFTLDFQDQAAVGHILQERLDWHVFRSRRLQDRKVFDRACKKYQRWLLAEHTKSPHCEYKTNGVMSDTPNSFNSFSMPNINPNIPHYSPTAITRSHSSPESSFRNPKDDGTTTHRFDPAIRPSAQSSPSALHLITELLPTQRLSRSMRVFVAWKASS